MRVIPVIDLLNGQAVRAIGGRRHEYRPLVSPLVDSPDPLHVAERLLNAAGVNELYVADLDAIITGMAVTSRVSDFLTATGACVWFDGGFRTLDAALAFTESVRPVIASETFGPPVRCPRPLAYSIDLRNGVVVSSTSESPLSLAGSAVANGFETLIILDVARVGTESGPGTESLCESLRAKFPNVELIFGGGIRGLADIQRLEDAGADAVLVATALHDGRLWR